MRLLFSVGFLLMLSISGPAQDLDRSKLESNFYYRALVAALAARTQDAKYALPNDPLHHVIIMKDDQLNIGFPARIGDVQIEYLTSEDLRTRHRSLKHEIPILVMRPMSNEDDRVIVDFTRYWFSAAKKTNLIGLEGGYRVVLAYDCSRKVFVVESAKLWGI